MSEPRLAVGCIVRGCPDPESATATAPVCWTSDLITSVSGATGNLATAVFRGRIVRGARGVDGYTSQVSLDEPISAGGNLKIVLADEPITATRRDLSQLFAPDPANTVTKTWIILTTTPHLPKGTTSFDIQGINLPAVNQILWIEEEAVKVTAASADPFAVNIFSVTVQRGVLGSRDREHVISPANYGLSDGWDACLVLTNRPDFDRFVFEVELYQFQVDGTTAVNTLEFFPRFTDGRPVPDETSWAINTKDFGKYLKDRKTKASGETKLTYAIQVLQAGGLPPWLQDTFQNFSDGFAAGIAGAVGSLPLTVRLWCTVYEGERILNRRFRLPYSKSVDTTALSTFASRLFSYPDASSPMKAEFVVSAGGYLWTFRPTALSYVTGPEWNTDLDLEFIAIDCSLFASVQEDKKQASIRDNPVPGYPATFQIGESTFISPGTVLTNAINAAGASQQDIERQPRLNQGWSTSAQDRVRVELGENPPSVKRRYWLENVRPIQAALILMLSRHGGGVNNATYDLIPGDLCPGVDLAFLSMGATTGTPITNDPRTTQLLQLDELLTTVENIPLDADGFDLGGQLKRIAKLYCLLSAQVVAGWTLRQIAAPVQASAPAALKQVVGKGKLVSQSSRLQPISALVLQGGYHPITLKEQWSQPIYLLNQGDTLASADPLRIWQAGGSISPEAIFSGPLGQLIRVAFLMQRGGPPVYKVPTKRLRARVDVGDLLTWLDSSIPAPGGRGVAQGAGRWVCVGRDVVLTSGDQFVYLMVDSLNDLNYSNGIIGVAWLVDAASDNADGSFSLRLKPLVTSSDNLSAIDPDETLSDSQSQGWYVRLITEDKHNPAGFPSRPGALELYGVVLNVIVGKATGSDAWIDLTIAVDSSWSDNFDPATIPTNGGAYLMLSDLRPAASNPEGLNVGPDEAAQQNYAIVTPGDADPSTAQVYGGSITQIGP